jgi:hypothetical protein
MNVEALLKVIETLEATPEDLNLRSWHSCAIGHSARNPWFTERGLKLSGLGCLGYPVFQDTICWDAVKDFFNLTAYQCNWLFNADYYQDDDYDELTAVNKQQVINRIKEFVKGIS